MTGEYNFTSTFVNQNNIENRQIHKQFTVENTNS